MKGSKVAVILLVLGVVSLGWAQDETYPQPSKESQRYREYRHLSTDPIYALAKIKSLIKTIKADNEDNRALPAKKFNSLTTKEKFSYVMLHGEDFSQNCDAMPPIIDEHKKVFAYFPGAFSDEAVWSEQQRTFMEKNRGKVVSMLRETIKVRKHVGVNLKQAIVSIRANELIPDIASLYKRDRKDHDLLTVMMILMAEGKYKPFLNTEAFKTLYSDNAYYGSSLTLSAALEKEIIGLATAFYKSRTS